MKVTTTHSANIHLENQEIKILAALLGQMSELEEIDFLTRNGLSEEEAKEGADFLFDLYSQLNEI